MSRTTRPRTLLVAVLTTGLLLAACGDDDDETSDAAAGDTTTTVASSGEEVATEEEASETEASETEGTESTEEGSEPAGEVLEVEAVDYAFQGLPDEVPAGTKLSFTNSSEAELHELVAMRLPDSETRSVPELLALPEEELMRLFPGPPATVLLAAPGGETIQAVGDGTLSEPGRYAILCFIPTGADPAAYLEQAGPDGPPEVEGGPPHVAHGMFAELVVG